MPLTQEQREAIKTEALTWVGTRYIGWSCVKHVGVDCGQLLYGVFRASGHVPEVQLPKDYRIDISQHRASTEYVDLIAQFMREIPEAEAQVGDVVVAKLGLAFAHAGIIVEHRDVKDFDIVDAQLHGGVKVRHGYHQPKFEKAQKKYFTLRDEFQEVHLDATVFVQGVTTCLRLEDK
jgi:hypothetical protein